MTQREKIGIGIIVCLFTVFGIVLYITIRRPAVSPGNFDSNVIIEQRVKNVNKSR